MGCDGAIGKPVYANEFQSTHPCGVRPVTNEMVTVQDVSIHAPVWGATHHSDSRTIGRCFNPRTRVGCDDSLANSYNDLSVSIHAPVWGATSAGFFVG